MLISRRRVVLALTSIGLVAGCASTPIDERPTLPVIGTSVAGSSAGTTPPSRSPSASTAVPAQADRPPESAPLPTEPTGRISLMTCDGATVTAVEIDAATGKLSAEHVFPLHGGFIDGSDVRTDSSYNCYADGPVPPQALRRTFTSDFTRVAATTVIGFDLVQYVITIDTNGNPEQHAVYEGDRSGWADPPLFDADDDLQWRRDIPYGITDGEYTPGQIEIWTAATGGSTPLLTGSAPRRGPDRLRPYVLGPDGASRVWLGDSQNLDDLVPGNPAVDGWPSPGGSFTASWTYSQDAAQVSITDSAGRSSGYEYVDCLPTAWLDDDRLLCTGSPFSDAATGVGILEVRGNNGLPIIEPVPVREPDGIHGGGAAFTGEHLYDAVPAPDATLAAVLGGDQDQPVLHIIDMESGEDVRLVPLAPGRWRALGWA